MNPIVMALLGRQQGQPGMGGGMPGQMRGGGMPMGGMPQGMPMQDPPRRWEGNRPLTLDQLNKMKWSGQSLPSDWMSKLAPAEFAQLNSPGPIY